MKILITGANGFLGHYLTEQLLRADHLVIATGKGESRLPFGGNSNFLYQSMDFTDPFSVHDAMTTHAPDVVVHAGAMSKPDECEQNQWRAYITNVEATVTMLVNAEEHRCFFVFISTDFVFDGEKGMYSEDDSPNPVNFYGKTKLEAEEAVFEYEYDWAIVRTVLVYGKPQSGRSNILTMVREKLDMGESYRVVDDQVRTPTYVEDLASGIVSIIEKRAKGVFHISGEDTLTPYQMACETAQLLGLNSSLLTRATAADFSQPATRPPRTGFVIEKAKKLLGYKPISFSEGLRRTFE
ncbi:MAG: SDR family oxidoreductase [Chitinophagaceae bacterium]|nr:SDR family oxidoreductase [Chitinophagaceae bacterium]